MTYNVRRLCLVRPLLEGGVAVATASFKRCERFKLLALVSLARAYNLTLFVAFFVLFVVHKIKGHQCTKYGHRFVIDSLQVPRLGKIGIHPVTKGNPCCLASTGV